MPTINPRDVLWRLLTVESELTEWFGNPDSLLRRRLVEIDPNHALLKMGVVELQELSIKLDRQLMRCVRFGRPPEPITDTLALFARLRKGGAMQRSYYLDAIWLAITDAGFRRESLGDAREALKRRGLHLSQEEFGKFRWFDPEKLKEFGDVISEAIGDAISKLPSEQPIEHIDAESSEDEERLQYVYSRHKQEINAIISTANKIAQTDPNFSIDEFDPGVPAPDYATFLNVLQSMRYWKSDTNGILMDTGYSFGRLLMLVRMLGREGLLLPPLLDTNTIAPDIDRWFVEATSHDRAPLDEKFHQSPCDPRSVVSRVSHIRRHCWLRKKKVLVLGDDDGVSIALARLTEADVHVIDIDPAVLNFLAQAAKRAGASITTHLHDLREPLPGDLTGKFWLVSADPPQNLVGEKFFFDRAVEALSDQMGLRIYMSVTPLWMGSSAVHNILRHTLEDGFAPREILKSQMRFNICHPFDPPLDGAEQAKVVEVSLRDTLNMACDLYILQRMDNGYANKRHGNVLTLEP